LPLKVITPGVDEITTDELGVDGIDDDSEDMVFAELPTEDPGLLLAGTKLDDPPPLPPQANSNVDTHNSSVRALQCNIARAIVVLISRPMRPTPLLIQTDYIKHSQDHR
jgi:hypothetical protein